MTATQNPASGTACLSRALTALEARDPRAAVAAISRADRPLLGDGPHPARVPLRAAETAADIGRWELATARLYEVADLLGVPIPSHA